jgi:hypothetical protein
MEEFGRRDFTSKKLDFWTKHQTNNLVPFVRYEMYVCCTKVGVNKGAFGRFSNVNFTKKINKIHLIFCPTVVKHSLLLDRRDI